jgi:hypothetical protein
VDGLKEKIKEFESMTKRSALDDLLLRNWKRSLKLLTT